MSGDRIHNRQAFVSLLHGDLIIRTLWLSPNNNIFSKDIILFDLQVSMFHLYKNVLI